MSMGLSFIDFSGEYGMRHFFRSLSDADFAALNLFHIRIAVTHLFSDAYHPRAPTTLLLSSTVPGPVSGSVAGPLSGSVREPDLPPTLGSVVVDQNSSRRTRRTLYRQAYSYHPYRRHHYNLRPQ